MVRDIALELGNHLTCAETISREVHSYYVMIPKITLTSRDNTGADVGGTKGARAPLNFH